MLRVHFFAPPPFSGVGSVFHQPSPLSMCYSGSLFVFQFCGTVWFRMLLSGLGDDSCDLLTCPTSGNGLLPSCSWPSCLSYVCLLILQCWDQLLAPPFSLVHFQHFLPLCCWARLQFTVCYSGLLGGVSLSRCCDVLCSQWWLGEFCMVHCSVCSVKWCASRFGASSSGAGSGGSSRGSNEKCLQIILV
jgi:hypothetical protein